LNELLIGEDVEQLTDTLVILFIVFLNLPVQCNTVLLMCLINV